MKAKKEKIIATILKESPIYSGLNWYEKRVLIKGLLNSYPDLLENGQEDIEIGYEASWLGLQSDIL